MQEALALGERDLDPHRGSVLVRHGKGGRRREIGMDAWGWEELQPWLAARIELPSLAAPRREGRDQTPDLSTTNPRFGTSRPRVANCGRFASEGVTRKRRLLRRPQGVGGC